MNNSEKQQGNSKVVGRPWEPGKSGNPNGRPKKDKTFSDTARELLAAKQIQVNFTVNGRLKSINIETDENMYYGLVSALIIEGMKGNVKAIKELVDRVEGKPSQAVEVSGVPGFQAPDLSHLSVKHLSELLNQRENTDGEPVEH